MDKCKSEYEKWMLKFERKSKAYLNKKFLEYDRKCKNEIRKLEWKEEVVYKEKKKPFNLVQFAAELMQENARLRDTNEEGMWYCISSDTLHDWGHLEWGHRYSRMVRNIMLCIWNINAQCKSCNFTTWPRWDKGACERTNALYDINLAKKYSQGVVNQLREWSEAYFKKDYDENWVIGTQIIKKDAVESYLKKTYIPELIEENERRWAGKNFYKPKRKWREVWNKFLSSNINNG